MTMIYIDPKDDSDPANANFTIDIYGPSGIRVRHFSNLIHNPSDPYYLGAAWWTADYNGQNGQYRIVVSKPRADGGNITHQSTFEVKNLVITSAKMEGSDTPSVIAWNPDKPASSSLAITIDAAYEVGRVRADIQLYDCDGLPYGWTTLNSNIGVCGKHGPLTLRYALSDMGLANPGIYFYSVHVYSENSVGIITNTGTDTDSDKTSSRLLQSKLKKLTPTSDDGTTASYDVTYAIGGQVRAESAVLEFYDTDNKLRLSKPIDPRATGEILVGEIYGDNTVSLDLPSGVPGTLVMQVKDIPNSLDKNRQKPALQSGKRNVLSYIVGFYHEDYTKDVYDEPQILKKAFQYFNISRDFNLPEGGTAYIERSVWGFYQPTGNDIKNAKGATYHALPDLLAANDANHTAWYFQGTGVGEAAEITIGTMQKALLHASSMTQEGQQQPLRVIAFGGHSAYNGGQIRLRGGQHTDPNTRFLVPSAAYHQDPTKRDYLDTNNMDYPISGFAAEEIEEMIPAKAQAANKSHNMSASIPTANLLDNLDLAVLIGCTVGMGNNSPLADEFVKLGAKCVLRLGNTLSHLGAESVFMTYFTAALRRQDTSIFAAAEEADKLASKFMVGRDEQAYGNMETDHRVIGAGQNNILKP